MELSRACLESIALLEFAAAEPGLPPEIQESINRVLNELANVQLAIDEPITLTVDLLVHPSPPSPWGLNPEVKQESRRGNY